jgi:hypothetical protein
MRNSVPRCRLLGVTVPIILFTLSSIARAQTCPDPPPTVPSQIPGEEHESARRESEMTTSAPAGESPSPPPLISFIDSPTATCYQPNPAVDVCWINWYYLSVSASPNYMICMEVTINEIGKVARYQGFFQTSMYVPYNMHDRGFRVPCGAPGASGDPDRGLSYGYTIRAQDSVGLRSANYGSVTCPPYAP